MRRFGEQHGPGSGRAGRGGAGPSSATQRVLWAASSGVVSRFRLGSVAVCASLGCWGVLRVSSGVSVSHPDASVVTALN
eukprot:4831671-Prymnesium_polylepis.3